MRENYVPNFNSLIFIICLLKFSSTTSLLCAQVSKNPEPKFSPEIDYQIEEERIFRIKITNLAAFNVWRKENSFSNLKIKSVIEDSSIILLCTRKFEILKRISECPYVEFIDYGDRIAKEESENDLTGFRVNKISPLHNLYPDLNGKGIKISVKEKAFDKDDIDFKGRVMDLANFPKSFTTHATTMASIMAGGGNSSPYGKGVAWQADLFTSDFANLMPDAVTSLVNRGIYIQNHSYGVAIENYYGIETQAYDKQCKDNPQLIHIFSAGNSGDKSSNSGIYAGLTGFANLTAQFKMSKNTISVGEIGQDDLISTLSSRGPAYDGRVKPEVVAYGGFGSSESAALVSGVCALIQQSYYNTNTQIPNASLVKALLVNGAKDLGRPEVDFEYGFGKIDALAAVKTIQEKRFVEGTIVMGEEKTYTIEVPININKLKITLVWHEQEAEVNNSKALINDLDLVLKKTTKTWRPWVLSSTANKDSLSKSAVRDVDRLNNIEQITVEKPEGGSYQIVIQGFHVINEKQDFSLAYSYENASSWVFPGKNDYVQSSKRQTIAWESNLTSQPGKLEFKYVDTAVWETLAFLEDINIGKYLWQAPDTLALVQFRINTGIDMITSDTILISKPIIAQVGFDCNEELMLYWEKVSNAESYELYKLGNQYLEPFATSSDTLIVIDKSKEKSTYFSIAPIFNNRKPKGLTINYTFQKLDCYFKSLLVREFINDTFIFDLTLGTTYGLTSVALQRFENGVYKTIQTKNNPQNSYLVFEDVLPLKYKNVYRVELKNNKSALSYSNEISAFYIPQNQFFAYPNPLKFRDVLTIIDEEQRIKNIEVVDINGKIRYNCSFFKGNLKELSTDGLNTGFYYLILYDDQNNKIGVNKIIIH